eukprot:c12332_g1_i1.p1 GENE.c12332_g1_i1~~c12332_g1_i1.p1  ORF type:complete len:533 (-),score=88.67 c12332_g1_i1:19-1617(-)
MDEPMASLRAALGHGVTLHEGGQLDEARQWYLSCAESCQAVLQSTTTPATIAAVRKIFKAALDAMETVDEANVPTRDEGMLTRLGFFGKTPAASQAAEMDFVLVEDDDPKPASDPAAAPPPPKTPKVAPERPPPSARNEYNDPETAATIRAAREKIKSQFPSKGSSAAPAPPPPRATAMGRGGAAVAMAPPIKRGGGRGGAPGSRAAGSRGGEAPPSAAAMAPGGRAAAAALGPLPGIDPKMQEAVLLEVLDSDQRLTFDDVVGLRDAKSALNEMIVLPSLNPDLFRGLRAPPKGLLLFGPPGNGKTMLAKALASEANSTFFNISASSLTSKWVGESEKLVRALFAVARALQPSIIFIDEIDSMLTARANTDNDSARRLKTEFLVAFDGVGSDPDERVIVMAATNMPDDLDLAVRRRFVRRVYVGLPDADAREILVSKKMAGVPWSLTAKEMAKLIKATEGFSNSDLAALCADAAMGPIRELGARVRDLTPGDVRPIGLRDFEASLKVVRPSVPPESIAAYIAWNQSFGTIA